MEQRQQREAVAQRLKEEKDVTKGKKDLQSAMEKCLEQAKARLAR